jgi:hypothetical protein
VTAEIIKAQLQAGFKIYSGFPAKQAARLGYVGLALGGIVLRKRTMYDPAG